MLYKTFYFIVMQFIFYIGIVNQARAYTAENSPCWIYAYEVHSSIVKDYYLDCYTGWTINHETHKIDFIGKKRVNVGGVSYYVAIQAYYHDGYTWRISSFRGFGNFTDFGPGVQVDDVYGSDFSNFGTCTGSCIKEANQLIMQCGGNNKVDWKWELTACKGPSCKFNIIDKNQFGGPGNHCR